MRVVMISRVNNEGATHACHGLRPPEWGLPYCKAKRQTCFNLISFKTMELKLYFCVQVYSLSTLTYSVRLHVLRAN